VQGAATVVGAAQDAAPDLMRYLNTPNAVDGAGKYATPGEAAAQYLAEQGIDQQSAKGQLIISLAQQLRSAGAGFGKASLYPDVEDVDGDGWVPIPGGVGKSEPNLLAQAAKTTYATLYPDVWKKHKEDILKIVDTSAQTWEVANPTGRADGGERDRHRQGGQQ
jgi:hypothetical protein